MKDARQPYKIAIVSTHGTGKTTLCYDVAAELKRRGFKVKVFSEIATVACEQGIPINESTTMPAQLYILLQHMCEELRAVIRNYEVVVCDRSVFDNWVYLNRRCGQTDSAFIVEFLKQYSDMFPYDALYKLPLVGDIGDVQDDGVRDATSEEFRADIYRRLNDLLDSLGIPHKTLPAPDSEFRNEWRELIVQETLSHIKPRCARPRALHPARAQAAVN